MSPRTLMHSVQPADTMGLPNPGHMAGRHGTDNSSLPSVELSWTKLSWAYEYPDVFIIGPPKTSGSLADIISPDP